MSHGASGAVIVPYSSREPVFSSFRSIRRSLSLVSRPRLTSAVSRLSFGVGNYAPTLAMLSLMGMDPRLSFPIMAAAAQRAMKPGG